MIDDLVGHLRGWGLMSILLRELQFSPIARMIDSSTAIVKDQPAQAIRARFLTQREDAFLGLPLDSSGMNLGGGRQDCQRCFSAFPDLAIEIGPGRGVNRR